MSNQFDDNKWLRVEYWLLLGLIFIGCYTAYVLTNQPSEPNKNDNFAVIQAKA